MTLTLEGDQHVVVTRRFAASPEAVYRAHTDAALIRQWMLGPDGWTMTICESAAAAGDKIHFAWSDAHGNGFSLTGESLVMERLASRSS